MGFPPQAQGGVISIPIPIPTLTPILSRHLFCRTHVHTNQAAPATTPVHPIQEGPPHCIHRKSPPSVPPPQRSESVQPPSLQEEICDSSRSCFQGGPGTMQPRSPPGLNDPTPAPNHSPSPPAVPCPFVAPGVHPSPLPALARPGSAIESHPDPSPKPKTQAAHKDPANEHIHPRGTTSLHPSEVPTSSTLPQRSESVQPPSLQEEICDSSRSCFQGGPGTMQPRSPPGLNDPTPAPNHSPSPPAVPCPFVAPGVHPSPLPALARPGSAIESHPDPSPQPKAQAAHKQPYI